MISSDKNRDIWHFQHALIWTVYSTVKQDRISYIEENIDKYWCHGTFFVLAFRPLSVDQKYNRSSI